MAKIYGIGEIAQISGISISTLTRYRYLKLIKPTFKLGGRYFFGDCIFDTLKRLYYGGRKTPEKPEIV